MADEMKKSDYLGLNLPGENNTVRIDDLSENFSKLDTKLKSVDENIIDSSADSEKDIEQLREEFNKQLSELDISGELEKTLGDTTKLETKSNIVVDAINENKNSIDSNKSNISSNKKDIGNLQSLKTQDKSNLVSAINDNKTSKLNITDKASIDTPLNDDKLYLTNQILSYHLKRYETSKFYIWDNSFMTEKGVFEAINKKNLYDETYPKIGYTLGIDSRVEIGMLGKKDMSCIILNKSIIPVRTYSKIIANLSAYYSLNQEQLGHTLEYYRISLVVSSNKDFTSIIAKNTIEFNKDTLVKSNAFYFELELDIASVNSNAYLGILLEASATEEAGAMGLTTKSFIFDWYLE